MSETEVERNERLHRGTLELRREIAMGRPNVRFEVRMPGREPEPNEGLLDTGSVDTILDFDFARGIGLRCFADEDLVSKAIGGRVRPMCRRKVTIAIDRTDCEAEVNVLVPKDKADRLGRNILGAEFMQRAGLMMDLGKGIHSVGCDRTTRDSHPKDEDDFRGFRFKPPRGTRQD